MTDFTEAILMMFKAGIITEQMARELYFKAVEDWLHSPHIHTETEESEEETN